jgi:Cytochrome c oxidase subunit IV
MRTLSDEVKLFARMSIFGLVVGAVYGVLTGERAGIVLLIAFGIAAGVASLALFAGSRRARDGAGGVPAEDEAAPGAAGAVGAGMAHLEDPIPEPGWAPLGVAIGIGGLALGAAYGPWLAIGGLLLAIVGGWNWLSAAIREADSVAGGRARRP